MRQLRHIFADIINKRNENDTITGGRCPAYRKYVA